MLRDAGFFGLTVPKEYGGMGVGLLGWAVVAEELAQGCASTALSFNMHVMNTGIVYEDPDMPEAARRRVAELVIGEGRLTCGIASEPGSSSHLGGSFQMYTRAKKVDGGYQVYGTKRYATMWEASDLAFMWVMPEGAASPFAALGLMVPTHGDGVTVQEVWDPMGMRATRSNTVTLDGVFVPEANVLYAVDHWAESFLAKNGAWSYGAYTNVYLGVGVGILNMMKKLSGERVAKGYAQPMSYHPDVRRRVAEVAVELDAARLMLRHATAIHMEVGPSMATMEAFMKAKYMTGRAVSKAAQYATVACGVTSLARSAGLERLIRDGATAPIQPPWRSRPMSLSVVQAPVTLLRDPSLTAAAKLLWLVARHLVARGPVSNAELGAHSGLSRRTVGPAIAQLAAAGWFRVQPRRRRGPSPS